MMKVRKIRFILISALLLVFTFTSFVSVGGEVKFRYSFELVLQSCQDSDMEKLKKFYFLKKLNIQNLKSDKLDLITCKNLKELVIMTQTNNNAYLYLNELKNLESFYSVGLDFNDFSYFSSMSKLKKLYLGWGYAGNRIKSSHYFESLPISLEHLCINGLENTKCLNFSKLENLETLYVSDSFLYSLKIDNPKIERLSISYNGDLEYIDISDDTNNLESIYIVDCHNLRLDIEKLQQLKALQYIYINDKLLSNEEIQKLSNLGIRVDCESNIEDDSLE